MKYNDSIWPWLGISTLIVGEKTLYRNSRSKIGRFCARRRDQRLTASLGRAYVIQYIELWCRTSGDEDEKKHVFDAKNRMADELFLGTHIQNLVDT